AIGQHRFGGQLHSKLRRTNRRRRGRVDLGQRAEGGRENRHPHHRELSSGIGEGFPFGSALNRRTLARAESERLSPLYPRMFGVAALPTHRPISNGHSP